MIDVLSWLLFAAFVIVIGYVGQVLFKKTGVADIVLLLLLGLAIGPVFNLIDIPTIGFFKTIAPLFASITLLLLLFEGGLRLSFHRVVREFSFALGFALVSFVLTVTLTGVVMYYLGWPLLVGLMLGAIIGGISSAVIIPLVNNLKVREETRTLLSLESALTDALCIIVTIAIIEVILAQALQPRMIVESIMSAFSIATVLAFIFALFWLALLRDVRSIKEHQYLLTIAVLLMLFVLTEYAYGNGAIAALVFGLVLGNAKAITTFLRMRPCQLDTSIGQFQRQLGFFIRTFFFIYIGIIFELSSVTLEIIAIAIGLMALIFVARTVASDLFVRMRETLKEDKAILKSMMARGLAAAVLVSYPLIMGAQIAQQAAVVQIAFLIILFSNIATTIGVFLSKKEPVEEEETGLEKIDLEQVQPAQEVAEAKEEAAEAKQEAVKAKEEAVKAKQKSADG